MMKLLLCHPAIGELALPLYPREVVIGRKGGGADIELNWDVLVSRRHARIFGDAEGRVWFEDLGSRHGSWQGFVRLTACVELQPDVTIVMGHTILMLTSAEGETTDWPARRGAPAESAGVAQPVALVTGRSPLPSIPVIPTPLGVPSLLHASARPDIQARRGELEISFLEPEELPTDDPLEALIPVDPPAPPPPRARPSAASERASLPPWRVHPQSSLRPRTAVATLKVLSETDKPRSLLPPPLDEELISSPGEVKETADLASLRTTSSEDIARAAVRFVGPGRIHVNARDRVQLRHLWRSELLKGGLFVQTEQPPPTGTRLQVQIEAPDGSMTLTAEVVHVREGKSGLFGGVGLAFTDLDGERRISLHRYVDGLDRALVGPVEAITAEHTIAEAFGIARRFIEEVERNQFYQALEVMPDASYPQINVRVWDLRRIFSSRPLDATPGQTTRLNAALRLLNRIATLLEDPMRRLEYDFRSGHIRAEQRIAEAASNKRSGISVHKLREVWGNTFPGHRERAAEMAKKALEAKQSNDLRAAIAAGRLALDLDPFHEELRQTVSIWKEMQS